MKINIHVILSEIMIHIQISAIILKHSNKQVITGVTVVRLVSHLSIQLGLDVSHIFLICYQVGFYRTSR